MPRSKEGNLQVQVRGEVEVGETACAVNGAPLTNEYAEGDLLLQCTKYWTEKKQISVLLSL